MRNPAGILLTGLALMLFLCPLPLKGRGVQPSQNPEKILEEFFGPNPSNEKVLAVLESGAVEPYKTELIKRVMAQGPTPEQAGRVLALNPPEPHAQQAWKIVELNGSLRDRCYVLSRASREYQDRAFASIHERTLLIEEYVFYPMREDVPKRFIQSIWDKFFKLNPGKASFLFAAGNAKGDFQEIAVLYSLNQELTASELESVLEIISEIQNRKAKEREEKLIEIMTREQEQI